MKLIFVTTHLMLLGGAGKVLMVSEEMRK